MRPFIKYAGGKTTELPTIDKYLPTTFKTVYEPFVGGGSVFFHLSDHPAVINDKAKDLIELYKAIAADGPIFAKWLKWTDEVFKAAEPFFDSLPNDKRTSDEKVLKGAKKALAAIPDTERLIPTVEKVFVAKMARTQKLEEKRGSVPDEDYLKIQETGIKEAIYDFIRKQYNNDKLENSERMAMYFFVREYCYSSMYRFNAQGQFNVPYGGISYNRKDYKAKIEYLLSPELIRKLRSTEIHCEDFEGFIDAIDEQDSFVFLDPPYDTEFSNYSNMSFTKEDQKRLAECLKRCKGQWMIVIKSTPFIEELYKGYDMIRFDKEYMVSFKNRNDRKAEHLLIRNYK